MRFDRVDFLDLQDAHREYGQDTGGAQRTLRGAFVVRDAAAIPAILEQANRERWKLWPISGGRNFGYGTALPVHDHSYLLDLSNLKGIDYCPSSHTFSVQPGVSQRDLADYLERQGLDYLVPTTGVGPNGSILGNALDGGYGLTPIADHFESLSSVSGYWGDGRPFTHVYNDLGCTDMARRWPAGTGPSVASLLRQGNLGVVAQGTVRLVRRPQSTRVLILEWDSDQAFYDSQDALSRLTEELPMLGGVISMNGPRVLATHEDAPLAAAVRGAERARYLEGLCRERQVAAWTAVGTLYGGRYAVRGAVKDIQRRLPRARVYAFTAQRIRLLARLAPFVPGALFKARRRQLGDLIHALGTVEGRPIVAFLRIAYALDATSPAMNDDRHPAKDGCGILWYAPLVPLTATGVGDYVQTMSRVLTEHGFDPLLAVTTRSPRVHSGTIPLLFRRNRDDESRARACYSALVAAGIGIGMPPYRLGVEYMDGLYAPPDSPSAQALRALKATFDPNDVISPGRYGRPLESWG